MLRITRIAVALAGIAAAGLIVYELVREAAREEMPEGELTRFPQKRPPFAEAAEALED